MEDSFENNVFKIVETCILVQDMTPLVLYFLHKSAVDGLNGIEKNEVEESGGELLILSQMGLLETEYISRLIEIVHKMVIDLLVVFHWSFPRIVFNLGKF